MLSADRCDPIDPQYCLFPWPNDYFTVDDASSDTGKRLNLKLLSMPKNVLAKPITPTEWNRNDGFSPGQLILARVPDLRSEEHTSELQSLMRISYAVFCLKKKKQITNTNTYYQQ